MMYFNNKKVWRGVVVSLMALSAIVIVNGTVFAQGTATVPGSDSGTSVTVPGTGNTSGTLQNPLRVDSLGDAINKGVEIFSYIAIIVAVLMIIYVGLKFVLAQGKPEEIKKAGAHLGYIVIGVAIILGARLLISIVINTLEATKVVSPTVIQGARSVVNQNPN